MRPSRIASIVLLFALLAFSATAQDVPFRTEPLPPSERLDLGRFSARPRGAVLTIHTAGGKTLKGRLMATTATTLTLEHAGKVTQVVLVYVEAVEVR